MAAKPHIDLTLDPRVDGEKRREVLVRFLGGAEPCVQCLHRIVCIAGEGLLGGLARSEPA